MQLVNKNCILKVPALLGAAKPMGPAEAEGWGTGDGLAIHPARDVERAAGVGWNGYKNIDQSQIQIFKLQNRLIANMAE